MLDTLGRIFQRLADCCSEGNTKDQQRLLDFINSSKVSERIKQLELQFDYFTVIEELLNYSRFHCPISGAKTGSIQVLAIMLTDKNYGEFLVHGLGQKIHLILILNCNNFQLTMKVVWFVAAFIERLNGNYESPEILDFVFWK